MATLVRVELDSSDRCRSVIGTGQCEFKAEPNSKYCSRHGGTINILHNREKVRNYNLTRFQNRVNTLADNPEIKSLREEIGITRMFVEEIINMCETPTDLIIHAAKIQGLIKQINDLVVNCQRLEERTGILLDKKSVMVVCDSIVSIISGQITDTNILDTIAMQLAETLAKIGGLSEHTANVS